MGVTEWDIGLGEKRTRTEIKEQCGGSKYSGIETGPEDMMIYTDPIEGPRFGYIDRWVEGGECFEYTGQGKSGDQLIKGKNRSLLQHKSSNKAIRLFESSGIREGNTKEHMYMGEFEIDSENPFFRRTAPDEDGGLRTVVVFRLFPVGDVLQTDHETSELPTPNPPASVTTVRAATAAADREARIQFVEMQVHNTPTSTRRGTDPSVASRTESDLVERYQSFLEQSGHEIVGCQITPPGQSRPLFADLFDNTTSELCEAKSSAERGYIRTAIGQLLDYGRHAPHESVSILVPTRPGPDLLDLLSFLGITCVYEQQEGTFERIAPSGAWPLQSQV